MRTLCCTLLLLLLGHFSYAQDSSTDNPITEVTKSKYIGLGIPKVWSPDNQPYVLNMEEVISKMNTLSGNTQKETMLIYLEIDTLGKPVTHTILESSDTLLEEKIVEILYSFRFTPISVEGEKENFGVDVPVNIGYEQETSVWKHNKSTIASFNKSTILVSELSSIYIEDDPYHLNISEIGEMITYPEVAREMGLEGRVEVRMLVDTTGIPIKHEILNSTHPSFTDEISKHIYKNRFSSAIRRGEKIKFWITVPFTFDLKSTNEKSSRRKK